MKLELKEDDLAYYKSQCNEFGEIEEEKTTPEEATKFVLNLKFDIFNIGKIGTGITDISLCINDNNTKLYFQPTLELQYEKKKLENVSFNIEQTKVHTVQAAMVLENIKENSYIFGNVNLEPNCKGLPKIVIIVKIIKNKEVLCQVEPISNLIA